MASYVPYDGVVCTLRKMHNRFNRPFTSEQVQLTLNMLREGAQARKQIDSQGSDLLYKGLHVIQMLWRECTLHDHLEETAAQTLATVETALTDCMEREAVAEAAKIVEDVRRLKAVIEKPEDTFAAWTSDAAAPR